MQPQTRRQSAQRPYFEPRYFPSGAKSCCKPTTVAIARRDRCHICLPISSHRLRMYSQDSRKYHLFNDWLIAYLDDSITTNRHRWEYRRTLQMSSHKYDPSKLNLARLSYIDRNHRIKGPRSMRKGHLGHSCSNDMQHSYCQRPWQGRHKFIARTLGEPIRKSWRKW
jgi:hypothetical protein